MKKTVLFLALALLLCATLVIGINAQDGTKYTLSDAEGVFQFQGYSAILENDMATITCGYKVIGEIEALFGKESGLSYGIVGAFKTPDGGAPLKLSDGKVVAAYTSNDESKLSAKIIHMGTSYTDSTTGNVFVVMTVNANLLNVNSELFYRDFFLSLYVTDGSSIKYLTGDALTDAPEAICYADLAQGFVNKDGAVSSIGSGVKIYLKDLFDLSSNVSLDELDDKIVISTTLNGETTTVEISKDEFSTYQLELIDTGDWEISIKGNDRYHLPATANVKVEACDKLEIKFPNTDKYLYRVGNGNAISISSLFGAIEGFTVSDFEINVFGNATYSYSANAIDWTKGTIQFEGTGVVTVTASCKGGNDAVLKLEVVDAVNATTSQQITSSIADSDVVLLNDVSGGFTLKNGHTLYGNGFKALCYGDGSYRSASVSYAYITVEGGATLDNIQVYCDIFPESYMYTVEMEAGSDGRYPYGYSAVIVTSGGTVSNSYIIGARNNILVNGNATIENTVLECGSLANIQIKGSSDNTVILNNVTTIQYQTTSKYDTSKKVLGFGVIVGDNESDSTNPTIKLLGDLKQYNWVTSGDTSVSNTYAQTAIKEALKVSDYQHTINGKTAVNIGIAFLNSKTTNIVDERMNKETIPYVLKTISMSGFDGQVYSIKNSGINGQERCDATADGVLPYQPTKNGIARPSIQYADANDAIEVIFDYDKFIYSIRIDLDKISGGSYTLSFNNISLIKGGQGLKFSIKDENGNAIDSSASITFDQLATNTYTLEITDNQFYNKDGELTSEVAVYSYPLVISATKTSIEPPKFENAGTATAIRLVTSKGGDWRPAYTVLTGVTVTYWSASESKVKTVDLSTLYNSGTISSNVWTYTCDDYTLTITGGAVHSDGTTITPVVSNGTLYFASTNKAFGTGTTSRSIILTYVFTDKNDSTTWNRTETVTYSNLSEYDYDSFKKGTLEEPSSGGGFPCVTPDTLVTLADGTQKEIQYVTYDDMFLVYDFVNGAYICAPASIVMNHGYGEYTVVALRFSDGTVVKATNGHGFYCADSKEFIILSSSNVQSYVGSHFIKADGSVVTLDSYTITKEYTESWSVLTAEHYNCVLEGMLTLTPAEVDGSPLYLMPYEIGNDMKYDQEKMQADIEKYGLYTYDDFAGLVTYEQFVAFGLENFKVSVGKGYITWDEILFLLSIHVG